MAKIEIEPSHRVLIVGTSGSGKSYLLRNTLVPRYAINPVVLDPKERWEPPDKTWKVVRRFNPRQPKQIIRLGEYSDEEGPKLWDAEIGKIVRQGWRTIIIDELNMVTPPRRFLPSLGRVVRTGRDTKNGPVGCWMVTQAPRDIPTSAYSESRHLFGFPLTREDDIIKWGRETSRTLREFHEKLGEHDYVYYNTATKKIIVVEQG